MKVSELTGAKLDYWAGKAEGFEHLTLTKLGCFQGNHKTEWIKLYSPSADWSQGGPIIEREKIRWQPLPDEGKVFCWTHITKEMDPINGMRGDTILQAAMRCFVASKFGEDVSDE